MPDKIKELVRGFLVTFCFAFFGVGALVIGFIIFPFQKLVLKIKQFCTATPRIAEPRAAHGCAVYNAVQKNKNLKIQYSETLQKSWQFFVWMLETLKIIKIKSDDIEKLKNIKNSIIVSTHPSYIDVLILISIIPHSTCFVADKLIRNPFFKKIVRQLFIAEGQPMEKWVADAEKMLASGFNLIIFPMGTRHRKNEFPKIRRGASLIAQKSQKNIVMINMETSFDFLQINQPIYDAGNKTVEYSLTFLEELNTQDWLNKSKDEVTFKTTVTKHIAETLYKGQK